MFGIQALLKGKMEYEPRRRNFPDISYSNAKGEYVRNTLFSRNNKLQQKDVR